MNRQKVIELITARLKQEGAKRIAIFGSYARHQEKKTSDIDVLVEFYPKKSLLELVRIERELSETTGKKIDLLTEEAISPLLQEEIKKEMVVLY